MQKFIFTLLLVLTIILASITDDQIIFAYIHNMRTNNEYKTEANRRKAIAQISFDHNINNNIFPGEKTRLHKSFYKSYTFKPASLQSIATRFILREVRNLTSDGVVNLYASVWGLEVLSFNDNGKTKQTKNIYTIRIDRNDNIPASQGTICMLISNDSCNIRQSMGMSGFGISSLIINHNSNVLLVGTTKGKVFKNTEDAASVNKNMELPKESKLYRNYSNPFNPTTTVEFSSPSNNIAKMTILQE